MKINYVNLNKQSFNISDLDYGKNQNIELKVGRKIIMCDIEKNAGGICIQLYDKLSNNRQDYSKYGSKLRMLHINNENYIVTRRFVENIDTILNAIKAQDILQEYRIK